MKTCEKCGYQSKGGNHHWPRCEDAEKGSEEADPGVLLCGVLMAVILWGSVAVVIFGG